MLMGRLNKRKRAWPRTVDRYFYLSYDVWISSNLKMEEKKTKPLAPTGDPSHNMPT